MTWQFNLGGEAANQEDEASIIDKVESFLSDLGDKVGWHSATTSFHGAGDIATLRQNVEPRPEADTSQPAVSTEPAPPVGATVSDPAVADADTATEPAPAAPADQGPSTEGAS